MAMNILAVSFDCNSLQLLVDDDIDNSYIGNYTICCQFTCCVGFCNLDVQLFLDVDISLITINYWPRFLLSRSKRGHLKAT